jgi:hypothetical protein
MPKAWHVHGNSCILGGSTYPELPILGKPAHLRRRTSRGPILRPRGRLAADPHQPEQDNERQGDAKQLQDDIRQDASPSW